MNIKIRVFHLPTTKEFICNIMTVNQTELKDIKSTLEKIGELSYLKITKNNTYLYFPAKVIQESIVYLETIT